jgi:hypothetical protein
MGRGKRSEEWVSGEDNGSGVSQPQVVGLIRHFWWDELNHHFSRIYLESGYPYPF